MSQKRERERKDKYWGRTSYIGPIFAYLVENILQLKLRKRTAFDVLDSVQLLSHALAVFPPNRRHLLLHELFFDTGVISQVDLGTDNEAGNPGAVVVNLGEPFLSDVFKRSG